jgi:hypothetical protein
MKRETLIIIFVIGVVVMGILSFFTKKTKNIVLPWKDYPSIFTHIKNNISPEGKLGEAARKLPDDDRRFKPGELRWTAGGIDGAFGHHAGPGKNEQTAAKIAGLINDIAHKGSLKKKAAVYTLLLEDILLDYIDPSLEKIIQLKPPINPHLHAFGRWLVRESPDRGPLKFGIALLGLIRDNSDLDDIVLIGKHDEFTLYSAVAVSNMLESPEKILWEMAKSVEGWGRIQVVERLTQTKDPQIKDWLLREGYKNNVMYEYLAYTCAVTGELHNALSAPAIDPGILDAAGDIIEVLINGGPAKNIDYYEYAAEVIYNYLRHLEPKAHKLKQFVIVDTIDHFLTGSDDSWKNRTGNGWSKFDRHELAKVTKRIMEKPFWKKLVLSNLKTKDEGLFWFVKRGARILNIDLWDTYWQRLREFPLNSGRWFDVMANVKETQIQEVIGFACTHLPLEEIATGPASELGMGEEYNTHSCLDFILQELGKFPGHGFELIKTGLRSPVIRNRHMALKALSAWETENWPKGTRVLLEQALQVETEDDIKESIQKILVGESFQ